MTATPPITRFAPSPTGEIHVGNARTALYNWFFARNAGGSFVLRFDDTDPERSTAAFAAQIAEDLAWLGIVPDREERQSARAGRHDAAAAKLKDAGLLYPCYETSEELDRQRARQRARGRPPVYDRRALKQNEQERAELESEGRKPHWRYLLPNHDGDPFAPTRTDRQWDDLFRGPQHIDLSSMSDPVLIRQDGSYLYTLPSIVDDIDLGITHVIRGDDHVTNTGAQIALFESLGASPPRFGHHNLLQDEAGEGLSKRKRALSVRALREAGYESLAVATLATLIGTAQAPRPVQDMAELQTLFDPTAVGRAPARFAATELAHLNTRILAQTRYSDIAARLGDMDIGGGEAFWLAVRPNIERLADTKRWWAVVAGPVTPDIDPEDADFLRTAASLLPDGDPDENTWKEWTTAIREATGRRGKALFSPLRQALTGLSSGPELAALLPLIGRPNILARLSARGPTGP